MIKIANINLDEGTLTQGTLFQNNAIIDKDNILSNTDDLFYNFIVPNASCDNSFYSLSKKNLCRQNKKIAL